MDLSISKSFSNGFRRAFSRNGLVLMALSILFTGFSRLTTSVFTTRLLGQESFLPAGSVMAQLASLPMPLLGGIAAIALFLMVAFMVVATRTLTHDVTHMIPIDFIERNILRVSLNLLVGGIVFWLFFALGLVLLIIPGLLVASLFLYFQFYVTVEDMNFLEAFRESFRLTAGNRFKSFGLVTLVFLMVILLQVSILILAVLTVGFEGLLSLGLNPVIKLIYNAVFYGITIILSTSIYAEAYNQLSSQNG